jgi:hypothetical protein
VRRLADCNILHCERMPRMPVAMRINIRDRNLWDRIAHIDIFGGSNLDGANVANGARLRLPAVFESEIVEIFSLPPVHDAISLQVDRSPGGETECRSRGRRGRGVRVGGSFRCRIGAGHEHNRERDECGSCDVVHRASLRRSSIFDLQDITVRCSVLPALHMPFGCVWNRS